MSITIGHERLKINNKISIISFLQICLAVLMILNCRSIYLSLTGFIFPKLNTLTFLATVLTGGLLIIANFQPSKRKAEKIGVSALFFSFYFIVYLFFQGNKRSFTVKLIIVFMVLLLYYILYESKKSIPTVLLYYKDIIFIIACISLFIWFFGSVLHIIKPSSYIFTTWSADGNPKKIANYYYIYFECQETSIGNVLSNVLTRNTAVFTEGPMASFHFSLSFLIEMLFEKNKKKYKSYVLFIATLTALSVTGFVVLMFFIFLSYLFRKAKGDVQKILKFALCFGLTIGIIILIIYLIEVKLSVASGQLRIDDYIVCFKAWIDHPLFGVGLTNNDGIEKYMEFWRISVNETGLANSLGQVLANGGVWIFSLYMFAIINYLVVSIISKNKNKFIFIVIISAILMVTIISYSYITIFILLWFGNEKITASKSNLKDLLYDLRGKLCQNKNL